MAVEAKQIYVNLPVKDVEKATAFFSAIGFAFNQEFSDEKAACLVIGDNIFAMLLEESYFQSFTNKELVDTSKSAESIIALYADSREAVDELVGKALAAGGKRYNDPVDHGFMYSWSFQDVDGHLWELVYMDMSQMGQA